MNGNDTEIGHTCASRIEVRPMRIEDLPAVFHLGEALFTLSRSPSLYRTWDEYEVIDCYRSAPDICLVATGAQRILGFVLGTIIDKRNSPRRYGYLVWLGVDPAVKRKGIGKCLFEHFKARMAERDVRMLVVDVEAENTGALRFFETQGFSSPRDHIYLTLRLEE